jgi:hypothetical protein
VVIHLNTEAVRTGSPVIDVEDSMTAFVRRIIGGNRSPSGKDIRALKEQLAALSVAMIRLAFASDRGQTNVNTHIVSAFDLWFPKDNRQRVLWPSTVQLSTDYFNSLTSHAVPLAEQAIAAMSHNSMALDSYCWLAHRLHRIPPGQPQFITWPSLMEQFGQGYAQIRQFRSFFLRVLRIVKTEDHEARFDADQRGMTLWNSPPPVSKRLVQVAPMVIDHKP